MGYARSVKSYHFKFVNCKKLRFPNQTARTFADLSLGDAAPFLWQGYSQLCCQLFQEIAH